MDENVNGKAEVLCRVCGDKASGKHYGVASCDGCRGFFKRSIRRNLEYVCKENGRCIVDVTRRNQCQACRFRKCLQVNMKRDAVQHERAPRSCMPMHHHVLPASPQHLQAAFPVNAPVFAAGFTAAAKRLHTMGAATAAASLFAGLPLPLPTHPLATHGAIIDPAMLGHTTGPDASYFSHGFLYPSVFAAANFSNKPSSSTIHFSSSSANTLISHKIHQNETFMPSSRQLPIKDDEVSSSEEAAAKVSLSSHITENTQSETLVADDNRLTNAGSEPSKTTFRPLDISCLTLLPAENVYESAAKLLFLSVKWARTIPSFLQLSYRDQNILLEESWSELFILTAAQWALPVDENTLVNNAIAPSSRHAALEGDARRLRETIARLTILRVDHTEYACLKALVLFKAECHGLCEPGHVELLQDQTHVMLNEYCNSSRCPPMGAGDASISPGSGNHKAARFGKLLLALPSVKAISRRSLEELLFRKTIGDVAIERLLADMIKASDG